MPFPPVLKLSDVDGTNGFRIDSINFNDYAVGIAGIGDVNGDGIADFAVGDPLRPTNGFAENGEIDIIYGRNGNFPADFHRYTLTASTGVRLQGNFVAEELSQAEPAGDVNGDGIDDILMSSPLAPSGNNMSAGSAYIVFGQASGLGDALFLGSLDGTNGFRLNGTFSNQGLGFTASAAGDFNHDGIGDIALSESDFRDGVFRSYVYYGHRGSFQASTAINELNGVNGVTIITHGLVDGLAAGDVNGDGIDDLVMGVAYDRSVSGDDNVHSAYVIFGKSGGIGASFDVYNLNGANGFRISGRATDEFGEVVAVGDLNGDGLSDLFIGSRYGSQYGDLRAAYVVFGHAGNSAANFNLDDLNGANGFVIHGVSESNIIGRSIASAGDVNGDGFDDIIIGANQASPVQNAEFNSSSAYIVFGKASGFDASIDLTTLDGTNGFLIQGAVQPGDINAVVAAAGDVNGDGVDDLLVNEPGSQAGQSVYVIYGSLPTAAVSRTGSAISQEIQGGTGNDTLHGLGGDDTLVGHAGSDTMYGGLGNDTFHVDNAGDTVFEAAGQGADTVYASGSYQLAAGQSVETLAARVASATTGLHLIGNAIAQTIIGNAGDDVLSGGGGGDTMQGLGGNDTYIVSSTSDRVVEAADGGTDTIFSAISWVLQPGLSVEGLSAMSVAGTTALHFTGNTLAQAITGNNGDNLLNGGGPGGADTMVGFGGNDAYVVSNAGDKVFEAAAGGADTVYAAVSYALQAGQAVETLTTSTIAGTAAINFTGNELAQLINGNDGINGLIGGAGSDTLNGFGGNDRLVGGVGRDVLDGGAGNDTMVYFGLVESTGVTRDLVLNMALTNGDTFQFTVKPTAIDADVMHGALNLASFDSDLKGAIGTSQMAAHHAVLFRPDAGDLSIANHVYLVVDANGVAGYQAGQDYVVELAGSSGTLTLADFV